MIQAVQRLLHTFRLSSWPAATDQPPDKVVLTGSAPVDTRPWNSIQGAATLKEKTASGTLRLAGVRWGFTEAPRPEDWKAQFQDADIDPSQVQDVYVALKRFPPKFVASHSFLLFDMKPGHGVQGADGRQDRGLCVSMEGHFREGQEYDLKASLKKTYPVVYQVSTWSDVLQKSCRMEDLSVERYKLKLTPEQKVQLMKNVLDGAVQNRDGEWYNLLNNSCYTALIHEINSVLPDHLKLPEWILKDKIHAIRSNIPNAADMLLASYGLLEDEPPVLTLPPGQVDKPEWTQRARWTPAITAGSTVIGAALGALIPVPGLGSLVLGGAGLYCGHALAAHIDRRASAIVESSDIYRP